MQSGNSKKKRTNSTREEVCVMEMHRHVIWLIVAFYEPPICNHDDGMHVSFITVYHHHIFSHRLILYDNHNVKQHTFLHEFSYLRRRHTHQVVLLYIY